MLTPPWSRLRLLLLLKALMAQSAVLDIGQTHACAPLQAGQQSEGISPLGTLKVLVPDGRQIHLARHVQALQSGDYLAALDALHQHFDTAGGSRQQQQQHLRRGQAAGDLDACLMHASEALDGCLRCSAVQTSQPALRCSPALSALGCALQCLACLVMRQHKTEQCNCSFECTSALNAIHHVLQVGGPSSTPTAWGKMLWRHGGSCRTPCSAWEPCRQSWAMFRCSALHMALLRRRLEGTHQQRDSLGILHNAALNHRGMVL